MTNKIDAEVWLDWKESVQGLNQLEEFSCLWQSNKKTDEVWTSFRLLPLNSAYLIASHYSYDQFGWSIKTKWSLYTQFDKALQNREDPNKISSSIATAIETQRKIVALEKVFAILKDRSKTLKDKACAYQDLNKIWVAKGKPSDKNVAELEMSQQPAGPYNKAVVEKMLSVYKDGYVMGDHFFENLVIEKK